MVLEQDDSVESREAAVVAAVASWSLVPLQDQYIPPLSESTSRDHASTQADNNPERSLDPDWISIDLLKKWYTSCCHEHGAKCSDLALPSMAGPSWLIDIKRGNLVIAEVGYVYAALSYVWGQTDTLRTTTENLIFLLEEGSIFASWNLIPRTIRDTLRLVDLLEIKYLWVDSLCIVQDEEDSKQAEMQRMSAIFDHASITIVAANGWDANHGLRGIQGVNDSRNLTRHHSNDQNETLIPIDHSIHFSRGWTFQEMMFARRRLIFHYKSVYWFCRSKILTEDDKRPLVRTVNFLEPFNTTHRPDVPQFVRMVRNYNIRDLSFPEDGLRAMTGLLSALGTSSFAGGFISGLPQMFFDDALLWSGRSHSLSRRPGLPSWSWVGWQGDIETSQWCKRWDFVERAIHKGHIYWKLMPTVSWFCGSQKDDQTLVDVSSYTHRSACMDLQKPIPPGWSRKGTLFSHKRYPELTFNYPIQMPSAYNETPASRSDMLLFGYTQRAFFSAQTTDSFLDERRNGPRELLVILSESGEWAGVLKTDCDMDGDLLVDIEFVSISEGQAVPDELASLYRELPFWSITVGRKLSVYSFYNVLWIAWEDGVAYRKGLGRIWKPAWELQSPEWIDLVLG